MDLFKQDNAEIIFVALGGIGEIGMNCGLYGFGSKKKRKWLMVDLGISFPDASLPGVDTILPDVSFAKTIKDDILGLIITHGHEDHYGAVLDFAYELDIPVYGTSFLKGMLYAKAEAYQSDTMPQFIQIDSNEDVQLNSDIRFSLIPVSHSIPESNAIFLKSSYGNLVHTGDWKLDKNPVIGTPTSLEQFTDIGAQDILAVISDSTNAWREGVSPSEGEVVGGFEKIFSTSERRVIITQFSSNIARIKSIYLAAQAAGREVIIAGRALARNIQVAQELGVLDPNYRFLSDTAFQDLPAQNVAILCTGSQGESRAQMKKIADKAHPIIKLAQGDLVVFSSRAIPGNEKEIGAIQNSLVKQGVDIVTADNERVHVTGHPFRGEIEQLYQALKPKYVVPAHGEAWHLNQHKIFAEREGYQVAPIAYNGNILKLAPGTPEIIGTVAHGQWCRDGNIRIDTQSASIRERRKLSYNGIVFANIILDHHNEMMAEPDVRMEGIPYDDEFGLDIEEKVIETIEGAIYSIPKSRRKELEKVEEAVRRSIRNEINRLWGKKPLCHVIISKIV